MAVIVSLITTSAYVLAVIQGELGNSVWIVCSVWLLLANLRWILKFCLLLITAFYRAMKEHYLSDHQSSRYAIACLVIRVRDSRSC